MVLSYQTLRKNRQLFTSLTGFSPAVFSYSVRQLKPLFQALTRKRRRTGRKAQLTALEDMLLCACLYYRTLVTQSYLGSLFGLHNANICRLLKKMTPFLARMPQVQHDPSLTEAKVAALLQGGVKNPLSST